MSKNDYMPFEKARVEKLTQEVALSSLEAAFDEAMSQDDWCLVADLESELRSQIDRTSMVLQDLRYLETN